jgi:hypothetical protein
MLREKPNYRLSATYKGFWRSGAHLDSDFLV